MEESRIEDMLASFDPKPDEVYTGAKAIAVASLPLPSGAGVKRNDIDRLEVYIDGTVTKWKGYNDEGNELFNTKCNWILKEGAVLE